MLRLLFDAHVSGRAVAKPLRKRGHDVRALGEERALEGLEDLLVLELAAEEGRILVTHNIRDFAPLLRQRAEAGRHHAGVILVHGVDHADFGRVVRGLERHLSERPHQDDWIDLSIFLTARHAT